MLSNFVVALSLSTSAIAWTFPDIRNTGDSTLANKACNKALEADIKCDTYVGRLSMSEIEWTPEVAKAADSFCTKTCSDSLQSWFDTVAEECDDGEDGYHDTEGKKHFHTGFGGDAWRVWNATCAKDPETGRYCLDIVDQFTEIEDGEERPYEELCHPCYAKVLEGEVTDPGTYIATNPATDYWNEQVELIRKKCGGSGSSKEGQSSSSRHGPTSTSASDASTVSLEPTSSTGTASLESALSESESPESNASGMLEADHLRGYWYALFTLVGLFVF